MLILAIDTSCDETSAAVVDGRRVLSNVISSQIAIHKKYGGVYPSLARRAHEERIDHVVNEALRRAKIHKIVGVQFIEPVINETGAMNCAPTTEMTMDKIDAVAVTYGPGLAIALEVGIKKAKELIKNSSLNPYPLTPKLVAVNHLEGHIYSCLAERNVGVVRAQPANGTGIARNAPNGTGIARNAPNGTGIARNAPTETTLKFPALCLIVSGGHTELVLMKDHGVYQVLGATLDDACGEALDKAAKILKLGYPGGPIIERLAENVGVVLPVRPLADAQPANGTGIARNAPNETGIARNAPTGKYTFTPPLREKSNLNFSYSGLKTQLLYLVQKMPEEEFNKNLHELAYSFQEACFEQIIRKARAAIEIYCPKTLISGGGVIANKTLRRLIRGLGREYKIPTLFPPKKNLITDNAAMIGVAAHFKYLRNEFVEDIESLDREPRLSL